MVLNMFSIYFIIDKFDFILTFKLNLFTTWMPQLQYSALKKYYRIIYKPGSFIKFRFQVKLLCFHPAHELISGFWKRNFINVCFAFFVFTVFIF